MAGRWYSETKILVGGTTLIVKQVKFHGSPAVVYQVKNSLQTARDWLRCVLPEIRTNNRQAYLTDPLSECFKDPPDKAAALSTIKAVLTTIGLELGRNLSIKVRTSANDARPAAGYVRPYFKGPREEVGGMIHHTEKGQEIHRRGDIHLDKSIVMTNLERAPVVLIHEAGHKFINLRDFGPRGYFNRDGKGFRADGLTWQEALQNADSYGWFVSKVFRKKTQKRSRPPVFS